MGEKYYIKDLAYFPYDLENAPQFEADFMHGYGYDEHVYPYYNGYDLRDTYLAWSEIASIEIDTTRKKKTHNGTTTETVYKRSWWTLWLIKRKKTITAYKYDHEKFAYAKITMKSGKEYFVDITEQWEGV